MSQSSQTVREEDVNNKARDLVRFFLASTGRKAPIKRNEIVEKVMKDMSRAFNLTMEKAKTIMTNTFGLSIVTLEEPNKSFCVMNQIELDTDHLHLEWGETENQQSALLMILFSIIFMAGERIQDEILWKALKKMGVDFEKTNHEIFGDVKKLVTTEFVQQGYLLYKKIPDTDPPKHEFLWGPRAYAITSKEDVLSFVCQIYGEMDMFDWPQQYDSIHGEGAAAAAKVQQLNGATNQMEVD